MAGPTSANEMNRPGFRPHIWPLCAANRRSKNHGAQDNDPSEEIGIDIGKNMSHFIRLDGDGRSRTLSARVGGVAVWINSQKITQSSLLEALSRDTIRDLVSAVYRQ